MGSRYLSSSSDQSGLFLKGARQTLIRFFVLALTILAGSITLQGQPGEAIPGLAKQLVSSVLMPDGSHDVTFEFNLINYGNVPLDSVQVTDNLGMVFTPCSDITVLSVLSDDLVENTLYDGVADTNLLLGVTEIPGNGMASITLTVNIAGCGTEVGPFANSAVLTGLNPMWMIEIDTSHGGGNPDPEGDGPGNNEDPTMIMFGSNPSIGVAKRTAGVINNGDGTYDITFEFKIENFGDVTIDSIQLTDDLGVAFLPCTVIVSYGFLVVSSM